MENYPGAMKELYKLGTLFIREENLDVSLTKILNAMITISSADFGDIRLFDPESSDLKIEAYAGFHKLWLDCWDPAFKGNGTWDTALRRGERVIVEDIEQSPIFIGTPALEIQLKAGVRACQSTPLVSRSGKLLGMFSTYYKTPYKPDDCAVRLLDLLALYAADIITWAQISKDLYESKARRKVIEAFEAERRRLFDVLETLPMMICLLTPDYHVAFANYSFRKKFGDSSGQHCYEHCFRRTSPCELCKVYNVLETGQSQHWDVVISDEIVIGVYAFPFTDVDGSPMILEIKIDITKEKKAEEKIRTLANIVESSNDAIITISRNGIITLLNKGAEQIYGYSSEEVLGKSVTILAPDNLKDEAKKLIEKVRLGLKIQHYVTQRLRKDGTVIKVAITCSPIFDSLGNFMAISCIGRDITETKEAEEKLMESEEKYRNIVETANEGILIIDDKGVVTYANKKLTDMLGYSLEEGIGRPIWDFISEESEDIVKLNLGQRHKGINNNYELKLISKDGLPLWTLISTKALFNKADKFVGSLSMLTDITERKKAEEKIRTLANIVESSSDGILTLSLDGIITTWNKGAEQIYGYSSEEILGKSVTILAPDNLKDETKKLIEKVKLGVKIQHYVTQRLRKNGKLIYVSIALSPIFDASRKFGAVSAIVRDITQRIEAKKSLIKAEKIRKKELHHRIKNNLQVISSLLDMQAEKFKNREWIKDSEVLEAFVESRDRVISMALIHEELYKGQKFETLDLSVYIRELVETLFHAYRLGNKNTNLHIDLEEDAFLNMDDAVPFGIIVNELVSNSLKHAFLGREEGNIYIKLQRDKKGELINSREERKCEGFKSTSFILTVSDDGVGIPESIDLENPNSLGMQLVTTLVNQLDGELKLKRNNETEFTIKLMVAEKSKNIS